MSLAWHGERAVREKTFKLPFNSETKSRLRPLLAATKLNVQLRQLGAAQLSGQKQPAFKAGAVN
jgi:hypothetical protein